MNNSKIWLVVNPTVGIPLFLTGVAVSSFAVHVMLIKNTDWIAQYHSGMEISALETDQNVQTAKADGATRLIEGDRIQVMLPDGSTAWAVIEAPKTTLASVLPRDN